MRSQNRRYVATGPSAFHSAFGPAAVRELERLVAKADHAGAWNLQLHYRYFWYVTESSIELERAARTTTIRRHFMNATTRAILSPVVGAIVALAII
ncbi:hypothetical protein CH262_03760 [Rhodococcus sp. 05-2255-1e]|nr:hypothetical protein CH262_03760 [Rhodococcus sp. 05-2255-1e]